MKTSVVFGLLGAYLTIVIEAKIKELPDIEDDVKNQLMKIVRTEIESLICKSPKCYKKCRARRCKRSPKCQRECNIDCRCVLVDWS